jgi:hypothetical protein
MGSYSQGALVLLGPTNHSARYAIPGGWETLSIRCHCTEQLSCRYMQKRRLIQLLRRGSFLALFEFLANSTSARENPERN